MRRAFITVLLIALLAPTSLGAWGMDVHRHITARALDGLAAPLGPFYASRRDFVIEHAVDPDLWRVMSLEGALGSEDPNHYLDIDALDEPAPYTNVPRDWTAFVARYGTTRVNQVGRLPWRVAEVYGKLVDAFRAAGSGASPYAADNAGYLSAVLAHYVEDAFVPFHAVENHDGQLTNQRGIHARFETELVRRVERRLDLPPVNARQIGDPRTFIFDTLIDSAGLVPIVLDADRRALAGGTAYDDGYYERFFSLARPVLERRLADAASGVASVLTSAWIDAGRPELSRPGSGSPR